MVPLTLQTKLTSVFLAMNDMSEDGNAYKASEIATAIKTFILTGDVSTTDAGAAPAGSYSGSGAGKMTIDADTLMEDLKTTFEAGYKNDSLADHMATDIDNACSEDGTVITLSSGTVTIPAGGTTNFSGPGEGSFSGDKTKISTPLKTCFTAMDSMPVGGNEFYALQFATAFYAYLIAGKISVQLKTPFISGSGSGGIA
jgi:hypothetical protein